VTGHGLGQAAPASWRKGVTLIQRLTSEWETRDKGSFVVATMKHVWLALLLITALGVAAQVASPPANVSRVPGPAMAVPAPSAAQLEPVLASLNQAVQTANLELGRLRIEKWKADSSLKRQSQENADSIQRNLTAALPGMVQQVRSDPQSLAAVFKLYRNMNVLYDVFSNLTESAGAFGPKNEYEALASDTRNLDNARRALGDRLQEMTALRDAELSRLRTQLAQAQQAAVPVAPKKIIVDEEIPKKPVHKKKPAHKAAPRPAPSTAAPKPTQ